jgi:hypothetical protein
MKKHFRTPTVRKGGVKIQSMKSEKTRKSGIFP